MRSWHRVVVAVWVQILAKMSVFHDEVEIEDFEYDEDTETYYFPCPCGDKFAITTVSNGANGSQVANTAVV